MHARHLFDAMAPGENANTAPVACGSNGIDAMPDDVLAHMLGFLSAQEAVQTCVLGRRWRHLWKSATGLHVNCLPNHARDPVSSYKFWQFVDQLLEHRGRARLETCELRCAVYGYHEEVVSLNRWIRYVVVCQVQMLKLSNIYHGSYELDPLDSKNLVRLELIGVMLNNSFCNFLSCPSLEHLDFDNCMFCTEKISSKSLRCLSIRNSFRGIGFHLLIYVPSLVSLRLDDHWCRTPVFETVPSLQKAFVRDTGSCPGCCSESGHDDSDVEDCVSCYNIEHQNELLLLEGLSEVVNLSMLVESKKIILEWDFKQWPKFNKLKTLLLNGYWCMSPDFHALIFFLKQSPVLEKLTLELFSKEPEHKIEIIGRCSPMERSPPIPEHLKAIEVQCELVDKEVQKVLRYLCTLNISFIFK